MRSAGLKNITAKNLGSSSHSIRVEGSNADPYLLAALASQALSIMVSLIPYIRELIRRHLNPKQAVMLTEFDKLKRDYQEHQNEIHFKLVAIMSDRLIVHSRTLEVSSSLLRLYRTRILIIRYPIDSQLGRSILETWST